MVSCFSRLSQFECDWNSGEWLLAISVALKQREGGGELNSVFEFPAPVLPGSEPLWFCTNWYCYALFYLGKSCGLHRSLLGVVSSRAEHLVDGLDDEPLCVWSELDVTHRSSAARPAAALSSERGCAGFADRVSFPPLWSHRAHFSYLLPAGKSKQGAFPTSTDPWRHGSKITGFIDLHPGIGKCLFFLFTFLLLFPFFSQWNLFSSFIVAG